MSHATNTRPATIVVCAYGPEPATAAATSRARRLVEPGGDVVVVAAHHGVPGAAHLSAAGPRAAREALANAAGAVLWLHDDVLIERDTLAALMRTWRRTSMVAVPWTDDPATDHETNGTVPTDPVRRSRALRTTNLPERQITTFSTSCMLGGAEQLSSIAHHPLTIAESRLTAVNEPVVVAGNTLAAHVATCVDADPPPDGPMGRPLLVAAMVVRNEAELLGDCLASLDGIVDRVEVCDTGSTDDTVQIAEAAGATVSHRPWRDDFAWARNQALERCSDAWFSLHVDADERLVCADPVALRRRLASLAGGLDVMHLRIDNIGEDGEVRSSHRGARILATDTMHYIQPVHERPVRRDGEPHAPAKIEGLTIEHLGYQIKYVRGQGKSERNIAMAKKAYESDPGWESAFQYARSLLSDPHHFRPDIDDLLIEALDEDGELPVPWQAWALAARAQMRLEHDVETALQLSAAALELVPADPLATAVHVTAATRTKKPELIVMRRERRLTTHSPEPMVSTDNYLAGISGAEIDALVRTGDVDGAFDQAAEELQRDPGRFAGWPALVASIATSEDPAVDDLLVEALAADVSGVCSTAIVRTLPPDRSVAVFVRYLEAGGDSARVVSEGMVAAIAARDPQLFAALTPSADLLVPDTAERIAELADRHGMHAVAAAVRRELADRLVPFVVTGALGSKLDWTARVLTALGHRCGYEEAFDAFHNAADFGPLQGEASWMALPHLDRLPEHAVLLHQVRDPFVSIGTMLASGVFAATSAESAFVASHRPTVVAQPDELSRCAAYWLEWNRALERHADGARPYVRYRIEDLDAAALTQLQRLLGGRWTLPQVGERVSSVSEARPADVVAVTAGDLAAGPLRDDVLALATEYGYANATV